MREKEKKWERERECMNFGNVITEIPAARSACPDVPKKKNQLWQYHCRNRGRKKNCGNAIAEIGEEKKNSGCRNLGTN